MTTLELIASKIIKEQERIIGPLAWTEASKIESLIINDTKTGEVTVESKDAKEIIDQLVARYERFFGKASREVCRDAARSIVAELKPEDVPDSLRI